MKALRTALVGLGKIARDQHLPALAADPGFRLVAVASPHSTLDGVRGFADLDSMLAAIPDIEAVSICTTPQARHAIARRALEHGCHVMLEKPPGTTVSEVNALIALARRQTVSLHATWHSREAAGVEVARKWLASRQIRRVSIAWREDVRVWHPGQTWLWKAGGLGVFDPGINALSIATRILPGTLAVCDAEFQVPSNGETPIAARLQLDLHGVPVEAEFDFRHSGEECWDIDVVTDTETLRLSGGGSALQIGTQQLTLAPNREYPNLYARFRELAREGAIDADTTPLQLVADAFLCARRSIVAPFVP